MVVPVAISLTRFLSLISETGFVSEIELEVPDYIRQSEPRGGLLRGLARALLRGLIVFAGIGGIHTVFGYCPGEQVWLRGRDVVHVVAAPPAVAEAIESTTDGSTRWIGWRIIPMHVTLCRHCHFPLGFELLTSNRMMALIAESQRLYEAAMNASAFDEAYEPEETASDDSLGRLGSASEFP
jgi:hypothetical protein